MMSEDWVYLKRPLRHEFLGEVKHRLLSPQERRVELVIKPHTSLGFELSMTALGIDTSKSMIRTFASHLPPFLRKKQNKVAPIARELAEFLAENSGNKCATAYWACGGGGSEFEAIGLMSKSDIQSFDFAGVSGDRWGSGTKLTPVVKYMWEEVFDGTNKQGVAVLLTDGAWDDDDHEKLLQLTDRMATEVATGNRHLMKGIVLGLKTDDNKNELEAIERRLAALNNYEASVPTGVPKPPDVWYAAWVDELEDWNQIFIEVVKDWPLGVGGSVECQGRHVLQAEDFTFGIQFTIPAAASSFLLHLSGSGDFEQRLS